MRLAVFRPSGWTTGTLLRMMTDDAGLRASLAIIIVGDVPLTSSTLSLPAKNPSIFWVSPIIYAYVEIFFPR